MIRPVHNKIYTSRYLAEFPDYQLVIIKIILMRYVLFKITVTTGFL